MGCTICLAIPVVARGWCNKHYMRFKKYGDPNFIRGTAWSKNPVGSVEYFIENRRLSPGPLDTDCWIWKNAVDAAGYGRFGAGSLYVHREAYRLLVGEIPSEMLVCHRCDIRACFNPDHLFIGTYNDNNQDMIEKGRAWWHAR